MNKYLSNIIGNREQQKKFSMVQFVFTSDLQIFKVQSYFVNNYKYIYIFIKQDFCDFFKLILFFL